MRGNQQAIDARYRSGNALRTSGNVAAAETELRGVLVEAPGHRDAAYSLAFMLREQGRTDAAAAIIATWWRNAQTDAETALGAIGFLLECAAYAAAADIAQTARQRWPDARLAARAGEIALALGNFGDAADALRAALDGNPRLGSAWLRLAYCRRFVDRDDADLVRFRTARADNTLITSARLCASFALGKALDDVGEYAEAVDVLRPANATAQAATPWSASEWQRFVDARRASAPLAPLAAHDDFAPIFIVGLPRTGTTLVANGLARHADVRDRGELNWIEGFFSHLHEHRQLGDERAMATAAAMIRAQMRRDDAPARFYLDKNPLNFRHLDLIAALFPNARIIHCRRAMRDTALSIWTQYFAHENLSFAYAFADIEYERLVADPEGEMRRLAEELGLAGTNVTAPLIRDASIPITTASVWQVRQPVYRHAVERWRRYAPYLPELTALFAQ